MKTAVGGPANRRIQVATRTAFATAAVGAGIAAALIETIKSRTADCSGAIDGFGCTPANHDYTWAYIVIAVTTLIVSIAGSYALIAAAVRAGIRAADEDRGL